MNQPVQQEVDRANAEFWDEMCGTKLAMSLGIRDRSPESLKRFDDWYFHIYPYLVKHIPFASLKAKKVLEVGLGYGTVCQKLNEAGAHYTGLDIAQGPVDLANFRIGRLGGNGQAIRGSILKAPFPDHSFDAVVSLGCYHHTGDLAKAIAESHRMLRPGGMLIVMVYNALSYFQWRSRPWTTFKRLFRGRRAATSDERERGEYDANVAGAPAPHTDFVSCNELRSLCGAFEYYQATCESEYKDRPWPLKPFGYAIDHWLAPWAGHDIYARAVKSRRANPRRAAA
jgi:SAM-dependent methyltransferase